MDSMGEEEIGELVIARGTDNYCQVSVFLSTVQL
jgi:hypothetical protein